MWKNLFASVAVLLLCQQGALAAESRNLVPMTDRGASTFYVDVFLEGVGVTEFLVDTGSSYMTINEATLGTLMEHDQATYLKDLEGVLADGTTQIVPLYRIEKMNIGRDCALHDVKAAVFPGGTRNILGLSALRAAAPFVFSVNPPTLELSNCGPGATIIAEQSSGTGGGTPNP